MTESWPQPDSDAVRLTDQQRLAWLRLIRSENVGPATFRTLFNHYGSASAAIDALPELSRRGGAKRRIKVCSLAEAESEMERCTHYGAQFIAIGEAGYPALLRHIDAPPPLLAAYGSLSVFERHTVAIVGSRNASIAGCKIAGKIAGDLAAADFVVVSGLARGIDTAAHNASFSTGAVSVLAGGVDHIYPHENASLYHTIAETGGVIISEMPFGWSPRARDFPRRNRLISGVSYGVLVVEATRRSGSLHTARFALEQGREVFAIPGSPLDPRAEGCNRLIKDGASLVLEADDIISVLHAIIGRAPPPEKHAGENENLMLGSTPEPDDAARSAVIAALGATPTTVDEIIRHTKLPVNVVNFILTELELAGRLERHGNQAVSIVF